MDLLSLHIFLIQSKSYQYFTSSIMSIYICNPPPKKPSLTVNSNVYSNAFYNPAILFLGPDCKKYSLNNNGPCVNGGKLICKGEEVASNITCQCPPNYTGAFCEKKVETVHYINVFLVLIFPASIK